MKHHRLCLRERKEKRRTGKLGRVPYEEDRGIVPNLNYFVNYARCHLRPNARTQSLKAWVSVITTLELKHKLTIFPSLFGALHATI